MDIFQRIKPKICLHQNYLLSTLPLQENMYLKADPKALTEKSTHTGPAVWIWIPGNSTTQNAIFLFWKHGKILNIEWFSSIQKTNTFIKQQRGKI